MTATSAKAAVCLGLLLAVAIVFGQTVRHEFHEGDDKEFVYGNPHVRSGLTADGVKWAFTLGPYGEWYPLAPLSHMLDCQLFGLNAWGHYLHNVLLHGASSVLLFLVLREMTGEIWPSAFVALLFAVHPQHVESVAWVAERKDVLSGFFFMLTLTAYLGYVHHDRSLPRYLLVMLLFALGLLAKPMLVTLPPLLLLLDFWPLARVGAASDRPDWTASIRPPGLWRLLLEKLPFVALAAGDCLMTLRTHAEAGVSLSWPVRAGAAAVSCVTYIAQLFYPVDLTVLYPSPPGGPAAIQIAAASAILVVITAAAVIRRQKSPYLFVGWFWFLGMLIPVLGLVTVSPPALADRYMYLPGIGLYIALAWGAVRLAGRSPVRRRVLGVCAGVLSLLLVVVAARQASFWRNDETLWRHALACTTDNGTAEVGLADALWRQGRLEEAIPLYHRAIEHATDSLPFINLGMVLALQGQFDKAIALFRQALAIQSDSFNAEVNLGLALTERKEFVESEAHLRRALEINPRGFGARYGLARVLLFQGKIDEACLEFERAIQLNPRDAAVRNDLGSVLFRRGKIDQAIVQLNFAVANDPNCLLAHVNLARALAAGGRLDAALAHYRRALAIDPNHPAARGELEKLLLPAASPPAP